MPKDEIDTEQPDNSKKRRPWFVRNRGGAGYHPATWQGWLILAATVATIVIVVVLWKTARL